MQLQPERVKVQKKLIKVRTELFGLMEKDTFPRFKRQQKKKYEETKKKEDKLTAKALSDVLGNPTTKAKLFEFCESEFSPENLVCYGLLETIESVDDFEFWYRAKLTYEQHIAPTAAWPVNIPSDSDSEALTKAIIKVSDLIYDVKGYR